MKQTYFGPLRGLPTGAAAPFTHRLARARAGRAGLLLALLLPWAARAQAPAWSAATTGSLSQVNGGSVIRAVATDAAGNVFVTGNFGGSVAFGSTILTSLGGSDLFVAKYVTATGTWAWAQRGGGLDNDQGNGIAVSGSSVYVTGFIQNSTSNSEGVLFDGAGTPPGTVQVNGATFADSQDLVVAKYTDNGSSATLGWTQVGGGYSADQGNGIAVSGTSVYVTGYIANNTSNDSRVVFGGTGTTAGTVPQYGATATGAQDLVVAKYTDNGPTASLGWTQVGGGTGNDQGNGIAVSGTSVYVTGQLTNNTSNTTGVLFGGAGTAPGTAPQYGATATAGNDLVLAKYTDNGPDATLGWTQVGGGTSNDIGYGVAASGPSVYVTGYLTNSTSNTTRVLFGGAGLAAGTAPQYGAAATSTQDLVVAKYTDNGATATLGWTQVGGGNSIDQGLSIAASGTSVYVVGQSTNNNTNGNGVLFGGTGTTAGTATQNGAATTSSTDLVVAKYTDNGATATLGWTQAGGGTNVDMGYGIAASGTSVYVGGYVNSSLSYAFGTASTAPLAGTTTSRAVLATLTDNATAGPWRVVATAYQGGTSITRAVAADAAGNVFVTGSFLGQVAFGSTLLTSVGSSDLFIAKYVPATGTWAWATSGGGTGQDQGQGIAVSGTSVYVTGYIANTTSNDSRVVFGGTGTTAGTVPQYGATATLTNDLVVAKYTDNGSSATLGWTQVGGGTGNDQGQGIAVSGTSVYVTGYLTNTSTNANAVVFGGTGTTAGTARQYGASTTSSQDLVVAKYTDNGATATLGWTQAGGGLGTDIGYGVAVSGLSVYVAGQLTNNTSNDSRVLFGGAGTVAGTVPQNGATATNNSDLVVAKYTDNGATATLGWTQAGGGTAADLGYGVAASGPSVYVTGYLTNNTSNDSRVLFGGAGTVAGTVPQYGATATNTPDLVVAKYTDNGATASLGWTQVGGGTSNDIGYGIVASGTSVYVTGSIQNTISNMSGVLFGGAGTTAGTAPQNGASSTNNPDLVVAKYTDNGATATLGWTQVGGGTNVDQGYGVAVSGTSVYAAGFVTPAATFGAFSIGSPASANTGILGLLVDAVPTLTAVAPNPGGLGQAITLTGTNLGSPTALTINGANALAGIVSNSGTSLTVRVPLGAAATGTVSLSTASGTATLPFSLMAAPGNALAFDGVDDYVAFGSTPAVSNLGPGSFTLEAWVYYDGGTGAESIIRKDGDYNLYLSGNTLHAEVWPSGPGNAAWLRTDGTATALPANRWAHVAAVWNGSTMQLYVNGQPEASTTTSGSITAAANLTLGKSLIYGNLLAGRLDEVRIYTAALTQANVQADLLSTTASVPASLGLYLNFDQGTPAGANTGLTTLYDLVNAQPATLTNFDLGSGNTASGNAASNYVASYALVVPQATAATGRTATSFIATWVAPANGTVTGYVLDVATAADFSQPVSGSPFAAPASATSYGVTGLAQNTTYYYRVRALNSNLAQADQGAASNTVSVATPLPVVLTAFTAAAEGMAAVRLSWATASEKNSRHFEVERSADGVAFAAIGTVAAAGTTATARTYALRDAALPAGASVLYYRLRQVDLDGTAHYSPVRSVALASGLSLYPNPALGGVATLSGVAPGAAVQVLDGLGRVAATATADAAGTAHVAAGLVPGVYVVRAGSAALRLVVE